MPALFTLPKVVPLSSAGLLLPGAKLTFTQTGTTTPQNTYTDIGLTIAHANPVIADSAGVFAPIYLDASLPDYRVKLTTSANVLVYQVDDYPAGLDAGQSFLLSAAAPSLIFEETDASANNKKWKIKASSEHLIISLLNDAESVETTLLDFARSGTSLSALNFYSNGLYNNDENIGYGSRAVTLSDQSVNNSTTLQDWISTAIQLKANQSYRVKAFLGFHGGGSDGFKWKITSAVSASSLFVYSGFVNGAAVNGRTDHLTTISHATISSSASTPDVITLDGYIRPSALAAITLQFAQNSATVVNTKLVAGSFLEFSRLS